MAKRTESEKPDVAIEASCPRPLAGIDEAGCAPLAGPVVAAAVIFDPARIPEGIDDSKRLSRKTRERLFDEIHETAIACAVGEASVAEIDTLNILKAAQLAMRRAVAGLCVQPASCLVDGNRDPALGLPTRCIVKGDRLSVSIAAAGILAKVARDRIMARLAQEFPQYDWARNAGYSVPAHREALRLVGVSPHHRKSFRPVRDILLERKPPIN